MGAASWTQSADGLTWTFKLQPNLVWSDGEKLTAEDYVFALQRAAKEGYDFNWYWAFAGGIKGWGDVTGDKHADPSTLGIKAVDDTTLEVTTDAPKSYFPGVASLWYPVPKHVVDKLGDDYALKVDTLVASGPFMVKDLGEVEQQHDLRQEPEIHRALAGADRHPRSRQHDWCRPKSASRPSWRVRRTGPTSTPDRSPSCQQQQPDAIRKNAVFAVYYLAFDVTKPPFDNVDVRKAFQAAINRDELTSTVLKDTAVPAKSILAPCYPGFQQKIADEAKFDPAAAKAELAKAGFPDGKGFPPIEIWYREQGGYNAAIAGADAAVPAGAVQNILGVDMGIKSMPTPRIGPPP